MRALLLAGGLVALAACGSPVPAPPVCPPPPPSALCKWVNRAQPYLPAVRWLFSSNPRVFDDLADAAKVECSVSIKGGP